MTSLAIMGLAGKNAVVTGEIYIDGEEMLGASKGDIRAVRGDKVAMIFQDPLSALHPSTRSATSWSRRSGSTTT